MSWKPILIGIKCAFAFLATVLMVWFVGMFVWGGYYNPFAGTADQPNNAELTRFLMISVGVAGAALTFAFSKPFSKR